MATEYKITLEITHISGTCLGGCKLNQTYDLSTTKTDNLCGTFYHGLFPLLSVFDYDGELWFAKDKNNVEVRCPDYINDVRGILRREPIGQRKMPPEFGG
jgi:uncharacterized repeat protein (TIGR04076 family)